MKVYLLATQISARLIKFLTKGLSALKKVSMWSFMNRELEKLKDQDEAEFEELLQFQKDRVGVDQEI